MRLNEVFIYGQVAEEPRIYCDNLDRTKPKSAKLVVRAFRKQGNSDVRYMRNDLIVVYTHNPEIINRDILMPNEADAYDDISNGDMVLIKGTLSTWMVDVSEYCPSCGEEIRNRRSSVYVDPLAIRLCERNLTKEKGNELLRKSFELSNLAIVGGWIKTDPEYYENDENGYKLLEFSMTGKRIRRILEDGPDKKADHPWVKVYGHRAEEYSKMFFRGSEIVIVGSIQARKHTVQVECPHCFDKHPIELVATELVPYRIEPVSNCVIPEPAAEDYALEEYDVTYTVSQENAGAQEETPEAIERERERERLEEERKKRSLEIQRRLQEERKNRKKEKPATKAHDQRRVDVYYDFFNAFDEDDLDSEDVSMEIILDDNEDGKDQDETEGHRKVFDYFDEDDDED